MANYKVELIQSPRCIVGEGPHWDIKSQNLYYIDAMAETSKIHRYSYTEDKIYTTSVEGETVISFIIPVDGTTDEFAVGIGKRVAIIQWDGTSTTAKILRIALEVEKDDGFMNHLNDGKADPTGCLYTGTMKSVNFLQDLEGSFYRCRKNENAKKLFSNIGVSNGLAWNEKTKKFYYIDSAKVDVKEYDYDINTGAISNERVLIDLKNNEKKSTFVPDGMTIDSNGILYVATWGGSKVLKINPNTRKIELEIKMPVEQITSVAFGGPNLDILFVTTASLERESKQPPPAGSLFKVTGLGVKGLPMNNVKL